MAGSDPDLWPREYAWVLFVTLLSAEDIIKMIPLSVLWHSLEIGRLIYDHHKKGFETNRAGWNFIHKKAEAFGSLWMDVFINLTRIR